MINSKLSWYKSSFSGTQGGNCVEVATAPNGAVHVRHSKNPDGVRLAFTPEEWKAFISGAKNNEFDLG
jgi:hypothetical protein